MSAARPVPDRYPPPAVRDSAEFVHVARRGLLGGIDLLRARYVTSASWPHSHSDLEIGIVLGGSRAVTTTGPSRLAPAGSIVVFNPGDVHWGAPVDGNGSSYRAFRLPPSAIRALDPSPDGAGPWFPTPVVEDPDLARRLVRLHAELETADGGSPAEARLVAALGDFVRRHRARPGIAPGRREVGPGIERVRDYLTNHYATRVRLETLAELSGISVFHLIRVFRAATGLSPYAFLEQVRIDRATALLRAGHPVSVVAYRTGFSDQSHLTRFFKRVVGVPPGSYRKTVLAAQCSLGLPVSPRASSQARSTAGSA